MPVSKAKKPTHHSVPPVDLKSLTGDHVHLGPGVTAQRKTNPAVSMDELPSIDAILLSHFHEGRTNDRSQLGTLLFYILSLSSFLPDHFDKHVQERLRKDLPIITTIEACKPLAQLGFSEVTGLGTWESALLNFKSVEDPKLSLNVVSTPGKHVAGPVIERLNDFMAAVPPTTGFVLEFGWNDAIKADFRIYISGDTLVVKDLEEIPKRYPDIDLLIVHLGGTTIPGPHLPLLMVTMDAKEGIKLVQLIKPKVTLPIHFDGEEVSFVSPARPS